MSLEQPVICYKFASRSRPEKMYNCIHNIKAMARHPHYFILVTLDLDDPLCNSESAKGWFMEHRECIVIWGTSGSKIAAINRDMEKAPPWDILINMSDDMAILTPGFDQIVINHMRRYHPDFDGVLHYPDGNEPGTRVMTLHICGKPYYDRDGYIQYPGYTSLWSDVEATEHAKKRGKYIFINEPHISHNHFAHGKGQIDEQYKHTESFFYSDYAVYAPRAAAGFPAERRTA